MFSWLAQFFSYEFIIRTLVVGVLVSLCASLLGASLVLKRFSMIGDGLSHIGFGALALSAALGAAPLAVSIPLVIIAAFFLIKLSDNSLIKGDAAIALVSTSALAIGVIILSYMTGMNYDIYGYMFGSVIAISSGDLWLSVSAALIVLLLYFIFYNRIFAVTFDENYARATGIKAGRYNMLLAALTAVVIVIGMRMMGAMLISSLIIFPPLTAMRVFKRFKAVVVCSAVLSVVCFFIGIVMSFLVDAPAGASVVVVNLAAFLIAWAVSAGKNLRRA